MNPLTQLKKNTNSAASHRTGAVTLAAVLVAAVLAGPAQADPATRDVSPVMVFGTSDLVPGAWSALVRTDEGVAMTFHTSGLAPGSATTVWWVVFNNPEFCTHGQFGLRCGEGDLPPFGGDPAVQASVLHATGNLIGGAGIGNFGGYLAVGDTTGANFGPGLLDARNADVHLIVRTHGDAIPGLIPEQIGTFNGGCLPGQPNFGQCTNVQASPHEPN
jgi:hypothetical protein